MFRYIISSIVFIVAFFLAPRKRILPILLLLLTISQVENVFTFSAEEIEVEEVPVLEVLPPKKAKILPMFNIIGLSCLLFALFFYDELGKIATLPFIIFIPFYIQKHLTFKPV